MSRILMLLIAFSLVPSVASSQCVGWVLWQKDTIMKIVPKEPLSNTVNWFPQDGFDTIAACRAAGQQAMKEIGSRYKGLGADVQYRTGRAEVAFVFPKTTDGVLETTEVAYLCFPGNFDPRR